jgi:hypothetical protein
MLSPKPRHSRTYSLTLIGDNQFSARADTGHCPNKSAFNAYGCRAVFKSKVN